jgi:hypothetical protein
MFDYDREIKEKLAKLTEKQYRFFCNFTDPSSKTSGEQLKSYINAGYKDCDQAVFRASRLVKSKIIQDILTLYRKKNAENAENRKESALERIIRRNEEIFQKAEQNGDLTTLKQCNEFDAKLHGLLVDRHQVIDRAADTAIDLSTRLEAARMAEQRLLNTPESPVNDDSNIIDADFTDTEYAADPSDNLGEQSDNGEQQDNDQWLYD